MDSGNSSSVQSSSGGDEEYDSRPDSISAFLHRPSSTLASLSHNPSQLPTASPRGHHHPHPPPSSLFDSLSTYLDDFTRSTPPPTNSDSLLNLDMLWTGGLRTPGPMPTCTDVGSLLGSTLSRRDSLVTAPVAADQGLYSSVAMNVNPSSAPSPNAATAAATSATGGAPRSSRKRSRASRRAPTTVLTTDTSNFRAMVQEFTGIPAPPFPSSPALFPRSQFDIFHAVSPAMRSGVLDPGPHTLLRPFAQKVPVPSFGPIALGSSSSSSASTTIPATAVATSSINADGSRVSATNTAAANASSTSVTTNTTSIANTQQLPSTSALSDHHQNLLNVFNFQSVLQSSAAAAKYNSPDMAVLAGQKTTQGFRTAAPAPADYAVGGGLRYGGLASSEGTSSSKGGGGAGWNEYLQWVDGPGGRSEGGDQGQFRPSGGGHGSSRRGRGCKSNCTGSASSDQREDQKGP